MTVSMPTFADVQSAAKLISGLVERTPLVRSAIAADLWLKLETLQPTGAFKLRGATHAIAKLSDAERARGVVCCSTGNHGRAVAYAGAQMGVPAVICLSELVPENKVRAIEALGARVVRQGQSQDDAQEVASSLVAEEGLVEIPPFDNPQVIAGQGTIALEVLQRLPELNTLLVPLSGGGLLSGVALAAKAMKPSVRIVGISMDRGAAMADSLKAGSPVAVPEFVSLADSLGGGIGLENRYTFPLVRALVDEVVLLTEAEIYDGMQALFYADRVVAEGAAAVGHAAVQAGKVKLDGPAVTIVTGNNVDMKQFMSVVSGKSVCLGGVRVEGRRYE